jgi:hypothetical protein
MTREVMTRAPRAISRPCARRAFPEAGAGGATAHTGFRRAPELSVVIARESGRSSNHKFFK